MVEKVEKVENRNYSRKLILGKEHGLGRKLESVDSFQSSFFKDNYYSAYMQTKKILYHNEDGDCNNKTAKCDRDIKKKRMYNIITFCGERGSGKTSVMDSVIQALQGDCEEYDGFAKEYEDELEMEKNDGSNDCLKDCEFICLDEIDASLLEENENILDVILSEMLYKLQKSEKYGREDYLFESKGAVYKERDIKKKIDEIYQIRHHLLWRKKHPYEPGESSLEQLNILSGSLDIREKLQELIPLYLRALSKRGGENQFLVISIDDLDLHSNAYDMLEQLHRYLMIPQVIIYIAVSEVEIQSVCEKHFEIISEHSAELAMSYLEKVLPYSRRIYLPAPYNGDYFEVLKGEGKETEERGVQAKIFLLHEIARKTLVFYDICGLETHFYEIENLRTLLNFFYLLDSMKNVDKDVLWRGENPKENNQNNVDDIMSKNFVHLKNDIIGRMATEKLKNKNWYRIFQQYYQEDFSSNGRYLFNEIINILCKKGKNLEVQQWHYNYGNLLEVLRMFEEQGKKNKPLVQCILAIATTELTQNYIYAFSKQDMGSKKKWKEYVSESVCADRVQQLLFEEKGKEKTKNPDIESFLKGYLKSQVTTNFSEQKGKLEELIESFVLLMMFIRRRDRVQGDLLYKQKVEFDILGFVINSMDWRENPELQHKICQHDAKNDATEQGENVAEQNESQGKHKEACTMCQSKDYKGYWEKYFCELNTTFVRLLRESGLQVSSADEEEIKEKFNAIKEKYVKWNELYGCAALPIYSLDIMYNVFHRVKKGMEQKRASVESSPKPLEILKTFYQMIGECLKEEDDYYTLPNSADDIEKGKLSKFYAAYFLSPFMHPFINEINTEQQDFVSQDHHNEIAPLDQLPEVFVSWFAGLFDKEPDALRLEEGQDDK